MNSVKPKIDNNKPLRTSGVFQLGKLLGVHISEKKFIDIDSKMAKTAVPGSRQTKDFREQFKYGVLSMKIADKDKSLF